MASRLGPAKPRGSTWNGAGTWLILSQSRQVNFSRTCCTTFHCRGTTSNVSVTSSPSLASLLEPQHAHRRARQMGQKRPARGSPAREGANRHRVGRCLLGDELILAGASFQLL